MDVDETGEVHSGGGKADECDHIFAAVNKIGDDTGNCYQCPHLRSSACRSRPVLVRQR